MRKPNRGKEKIARSFRFGIPDSRIPTSKIMHHGVIHEAVGVDVSPCPDCVREIAMKSIDYTRCVRCGRDRREAA